MTAEYKLINEEDIPKDLPPGQYDTRIVEAKWENGNPLIILEFVGSTYNPNNPQCLLPLVKE